MTQIHFTFENIKTLQINTEIVNKLFWLKAINISWRI